MKPHDCRSARFLSVAALLGAAMVAVADDWPQYRGAAGDGVWRETGIVAELPAGGPPVRWRVPCDLGYAGPAVADGRVYLFEYEKSSGDVTNNPGGRDELTGVERLRCLDAATGRELWRHEYDRPYFISYPSGPRCTPTVDGDRVYTLGAEGDLKCLRTSDGSLVWEKNFAEAYGSPTPQWGHSSHPLVVGDTLYCLAGGEGSVVIALDKETGADRWTALSAPSMNNEAGYAPVTMIEHDGAQQLIAFYPEAVAGLNPTSGEVLWSVPIQPSYGMSIAAPNQIGDRLFTTGYGGVSVHFRLPAGAGEPEILWAGGSKTSISAANPTPVVDPAGGVVYGCDANSSALMAIDLTDGARLWETKAPTFGDSARGRHGTAFVVRQGDTDRYWIAAETGDLILARLTPEAYEEVGRAPLMKATGETFGRAVWWSHPAFAERCVFARNDEEIVCVDLAE